MRKIRLKSCYPPGDELMLTAAVRDIQLAYPDRFSFAIESPFPEIWENNPHVGELPSHGEDIETIDCHYPLIDRSAAEPIHFLQGFLSFLNERLGLKARLTRHSGDFHFSKAEIEAPSPIEALVGGKFPYWVIVAGGRYDFTIKWWDFKRFQAVVDHFANQLAFVQVGEFGDFHPPLDGVLDFRGKTTIRELAKLVLHAEGIVCPVTFLSHLSAAVPPIAGGERPGVVIAGGRESPHWASYPFQQFIHTVGTLDCCQHAGCWKCRTVKLNDGDKNDQPEHLCVKPVGAIPRCMDIIQVEDVTSRIYFYLKSGAAKSLTSTQQKATKRTNPSAAAMLSKALAN